MNRRLIFVICVSLCMFILNGCDGGTPASFQPTPSVAPSHERESKSRIDEARIQSAALNREMRMSVYVPAEYREDAKYPVLYLLYGYGGSHDSWFTYLDINSVADRLIQKNRIHPLIIVSPDYGNSFGVNTKLGEGHDPGGIDIGPYEDYLIKDVIPYVDEHYSTQADKEGRMIGGVSMGGYAALYLGFTYPDLFSKIGAHSAAIWNYSASDQFIDQRDWLFANETLRGIRDPFKLASNNKLDGIHVYLDCGNNDALADKDKQLYELLRTENIDAQWIPNPGDHNLSYWSGQLEHYLLFYAGK